MHARRDPPLGPVQKRSVWSMSTNMPRFFTSRVRCQNVPKKRAPKIHMVAPITMAATPADHAGAAVALQLL